MLTRKGEGGFMPGGCLYVYFPVRNAATRLNVVLINELLSIGKRRTRTFIMSQDSESCSSHSKGRCQTPPAHS